MKRFVLCILYTAFIISVSLMPSPGGPSGGYWDKVGHFLAYASFGLLVWYTFRTRIGRYGAATAGVFLGGVLEVAQYYVPGRSASYADAAANTLGVVVGVLVAMRAGRLLTKCFDADLLALINGRRAGEVRSTPRTDSTG
jgi:VanZ family protein